MDLHDYDADELLEMLSPTEPSPLPNEPPPPPYAVHNPKQSDVKEMVSPPRRSLDDEAREMQSKIKGVVARLAQSRLDDGTRGRGSRLHDTSSTNQQAQNAEHEAAEKRRQKMRELRAATIQRVNARNEELQEARRREEEQQAKAVARMRRDRKEEQIKLKAQRDKKVRAVAREAPIPAHLLRRAVAHRRRQLLISRGLSPWLQLLNAARVAKEKAELFRADTLVQRYLGAWKAMFAASQLQRHKVRQRMNMLASTYYNRQLLRFVWKRWKLYRKLLKAKARTVSGEFSRFALRRRGFLTWKVAYDRQIRRRATILRTIALPHARLVIGRYYMSRWRTFVVESKFDRDVQLRTDLTWNKVQGWLANDRK